MQLDIDVPTYKCILTGGCNTGKTTFLERHCTGYFQRKYVPSIGAIVKPVLFSTTCGPIVFNILDISGQRQFEGLRNCYYVDGQCAIIMFNAATCIPCKSILNWRQQIIRVCDHIPIVVCGNKIDLKRYSTKSAHLPRKHHIQYYEISTKLKYQNEMPFLYLARKLMSDPKLELLCDTVTPIKY